MAITLQSFMAALSGQESGGDYGVTNRTGSGAYGKYQIMPANWSGNGKWDSSSWAIQAGLPPNAPQSPENQERVARFKLQEYYNETGDWAEVASRWYSGQNLGPNQHAPQEGGPSIRSYVDSVIARAGGTAGGRQVAAPDTSGIDAQITRHLANAPQPTDDPEYDAEVQAQWVDTLNGLYAARNAARRGADDNQAFDNAISGANTRIASDNSNISRAAADIDRFLSGQDENRQRAALIQAGKEEISKYGTSNGKHNFSLNDLGTGFAAQSKALGGIDPNANFLNYSGVQNIDPEGDFRRMDQESGVTGQIPIVPYNQFDPNTIPIGGGEQTYDGIDFNESLGGTPGGNFPTTAPSSGTLTRSGLTPEQAAGRQRIPHQTGVEITRR